jgi:hypothetical protein
MEAQRGAPVDEVSAVLDLRSRTHSHQQTSAEGYGQPKSYRRT